MSGATKNGFDLTQSKAIYWHRKPHDPKHGTPGTMAYYRKILLAAGIKSTIGRGGSFLHVEATQGKIWEALSGEPSDPERERYHKRNPAR